MTYKILNKKVQPLEPSCAKTAYYSKEDAQEMIEYLQEEKGKKGVKTYQCSKCGMWHLTSN